MDRAWRRHICLCHGNPGSAKCAGIQTGSAVEVMTLSEPFSSLWKLVIRGPIQIVPLCCPTFSGTQRAPLPWVLLCCLMHQARNAVPLAGILFWCSVYQAPKGLPWLGSSSVVWCARHLKGTLAGVLLCCSVHQALEGPASLLFSCH